MRREDKGRKGMVKENWKNLKKGKTKKDECMGKGVLKGA